MLMYSRYIRGIYPSLKGKCAKHGVYTPYKVAGCADQLPYPLGGTYTYTPKNENAPPYRVGLPYTWITGDVSPPA